jgi:hypothetical protein
VEFGPSSATIASKMLSRVAMVLAMVIVVACSPSPSPTATTREQTPSPTSLGVALTITGGGQVLCSPPYGCRPSLVIQADPTRRSPEPVWTVETGEEFSFPAVMTDSWDTRDVGSAPIAPPTTIQPGRYRLAGVLNLDSDVISLGPSPVPTQLVPRCVAELIVSPDLVSVSVDVQFP